MMHSYLHDTVIKSLVLEENEDENTKLSVEEYEVEAKKFMANYGLTCICNETVYRWMLRIGFKHETRRKGYFVDGHKKRRPLSIAGHSVTATYCWNARCTDGFKSHLRKQTY
jgi:hypothetical protein